MSESFLDTDKREPDFFGYYATDVKELLSRDDTICPFSNQISRFPQEKKGTSIPAPLFSNGIGALISESKNERLNSLLRQSVLSLTQEVDEIVDPVLSLCQIRTCLEDKKSLALENMVDQTQHAHKKQRLLSSLGSQGKHMQINEPVKQPSNCIVKIVKKCIVCRKTETPQWRPAPDGAKSLCNDCWHKAKKRGFNSTLDSDTGKEQLEVNDDLRVILDSESTRVEEVMRRHSSEVLAKLQHMEQKLEELLYSVMTSCRPMTVNEKKQLRILIQKLPPKNLERVVEIVKYNKPPDLDSSEEIKVELDNEDNTTLWRLYFYVTSVTRES